MSGTELEHDAMSIRTAFREVLFKEQLNVAALYSLEDENLSYNGHGIIHGVAHGGWGQVREWADGVRWECSVYIAVPVDNWHTTEHQRTHSSAKLSDSDPRVLPFPAASEVSLLPCPPEPRTALAKKNGVFPSPFLLCDASID